MGFILKSYILLSEKKWHDDLFDFLEKKSGAIWFRIDCSEKFFLEEIKRINPSQIFIPHWSEKIPEEIHKTFECILFHMTNLPYGRGGSPLQNLIVLKQKETMISAIKVTDGIDTGPVFLKYPLCLDGTALEIFQRSSTIIGKMIEEIIEKNPIPTAQEGTVTVFKRRKAEDGNISKLTSLTEIYDYIRMLDCEGYPNAFLELGKIRIEFEKATIHENKSITANVRITTK
jgi:methionyl-tRNA formyltransferase